MTQTTNRNLAFVAIATVSLAAGGAAYAAAKLHRGSSPTTAPALTLGKVYAASSSSGTPRFDGRRPALDHRKGDELAAAATYLGVTQSDLLTQLQSGKTLAQIADATSGKSAAGLVDALVAAEKKEIDAAVSAGRITQAQADRIEPTLKARFTDLVNGTLPPRGPGFGGHHGAFGHGLDAAATYLGISEDALRTQLEAGKTLAQIADATSGKSAAGLIDALVAAETKEIDGALSAGRITQAEHDQILSGLKDRITALVNGKRPAGAPAFRGEHFGADHRI
jgi:hypothetical protein